MPAMKLLTDIIKKSVAVGVVILMEIATPLWAFAENNNSLLTTNNPDYYAELRIKDNTLYAKGKYTGAESFAGGLFNSEKDLEFNSDTGEFSFEIDLNQVDEKYGGYEYVYFRVNNGYMRYLMRMDDEGNWCFPDNGAAEKNRAVIENPVNTPSKLWAAYVCSHYDPEHTRAVLEKVKNLSDEICQGASDDYEKILRICRWVSDNLYYDHDARDISVTAETVCLEHVLETRHTVCGGYANMFNALCQAQGLSTMNVRGATATDGITFDELTNAGINHEWSAVRLDDRIVIVDAGWNSLNDYENGEEIYRGCFEFYTDITIEALSMDHCGYSAEIREFFKAEEYFKTDEYITSVSQSTAQESNPGNETPVNDDTNTTDNTGFVIILLVLLVPLVILMLIFIKKRR